ALLAAPLASPRGVFVVDDLAFPKKGQHSVGVHRQAAGGQGKKANCQVAVALHYVSPAGRCPLALRLYLPGAWLGDPQRLDRAGVPPAERRPLTKGEIALQLLDAAWGEGLPGWLAVADAAYGNAEAFRAGLTARGLRYIVGVGTETAVTPFPGA